MFNSIALYHLCADSRGVPVGCSANGTHQRGRPVGAPASNSNVSTCGYGIFPAPSEAPAHTCGRRRRMPEKCKHSEYTEASAIPRPPAFLMTRQGGG